jgi:uncharacterized protein YcbK (DUF882 family)
MTRVSEHISVAEYACKCCGKLPPSWTATGGPDVYGQFFLDFEEIRDAWGEPILINSGYRCLKHNTAVGGEPCSVHLFGLALDVHPERREDLPKFYQTILDVCPELRLGYYNKSGFVHLDVGYQIEPIAFKQWREEARWTG